MCMLRWGCDSFKSSRDEKKSLKQRGSEAVKKFFLMLIPGGEKETVVKVITLI